MKDLMKMIDDAMVDMDNTYDEENTINISYKEADSIATAKSYSVLGTLNDRAKLGEHISLSEKRRGLLLLEEWHERLTGRQKKEDLRLLVEESLRFYEEDEAGRNVAYKYTRALHELQDRLVKE